MSDRPTPPDPENPPSTEQSLPTRADETGVLPQAGPTTGWPAGAAPTTAAAAPAPPTGPRGWWGEATSTGGGRAALIAVAVLGALLLMTGVALTGALVVAGHDRWDDDERVSRSEEFAPGMGNGRGQGNGKGQGQGNREQDDGDEIPGPNPGNPGNMGRGNGNGMGPGRGVAGLDDILHGEYTTNVTGTPTVMVVQLGQVTAYTAGTSLTVKSSDGYEATYALGDAVATTRTATALAPGVQVRVVAAKEGLKVTRLAVVD